MICAVITATTVNPPKAGTYFFALIALEAPENVGQRSDVSMDTFACFIYRKMRPPRICKLFVKPMCIFRGPAPR
jgi:hypothetical protein